MLIIIYSALIGLSFILKATKTRNKLDINNIFTLLWSVVGILAYLNLIPILEVSVTIHLYIILSIITFNIVYIIIRKKDSNFKYLNLQSKYIPNFQIIYIFNIIALCIMAPLFFQAITLIVSNGFTNYRGFVKEAAGSSNLSAVINRQFTKAVFDITALIAVTELARGRTKLLMLSITGVLVYTITYGGRYALMNFIIYYIAAIVIIGQKRKWKVNKKYIILAVLAIVSLTFARSTSNIEILEEILIYFVGSLSFLQLILNNPMLFGWSEGFTYGYLTFGFITEPVAMFIKLMTGFNIFMPTYYFNIYAQPFYNIGAEGYTKYYNNNTTFFYHFLRDFGVWGIVIGVGFLSATSSVFLNKFNRTNSLRTLCFIVFFLGVIMTSSMMYTMLNITAFFSLVLILLFTKKKNDERI